jgi:hypothetical protein
MFFKSVKMAHRAAYVDFSAFIARELVYVVFYHAKVALEEAVGNRALGSIGCLLESAKECI